MTQEYIKQIALDTIEEQQAETKVNDDRDHLIYLMGFNDGVIELALKLQPKTQAERTGHWIAHADDGIWIKYYECSKCGKSHDTQSDYCEKCGAMMLKPQESEVKE